MKVRVLTLHQEGGVFQVLGVFASEEETCNAIAKDRQERGERGAPYAYQDSLTELDLRTTSVFVLVRENKPEAGGRRVFLGTYLSIDGALDAMNKDIEQMDGAYSKDEYDVLVDTLEP